MPHFVECSSVTATSARSRGFTLIEMMVAVAVFGLLAAIATPNIVTSINRQKAISSVKQAEDFVLRARNFARTTGCETILSVDNANLPHQMTFATTETDTSLPCGNIDTGLQIEFDDRVTLSTWTLKDGSPTTDTAGAVVFNGEGGTEEAQEAVLSVHNALGGTLVIEVWPLIGTIHAEHR